MVALMCNCCQGLYIPNFLLGGDAYIEQRTEFINEVRYYLFVRSISGVISSLATSPAGRWFSSYFHIICDFFLPPDQYAIFDTHPFPFSRYDRINIFVVKPQYVGTDIGQFFDAYRKGCYDRFVFSWSNFTFEKINEIVNLMMDRFNPLFSPNYFYYSDDGYNPNDYAVTYTYDEFLVAFRSWINRFFTDFYKRGCLRDFNSYTVLYNHGKFRIEKEPK